MTILDTIKKVGRAVSKKDGVIFSHFLIEKNTIKAFDGAMAICAPINIALDCCPNALQFITAMEACRDTTTFHLTDKDKLIITSGPLKVTVDCLPRSEYLDIYPMGKIINSPDCLLEAFSFLKNYCRDDNKQEWARGIFFNSESAYATNNAVLVQYWLAVYWPHPINIPVVSALEVLKIGEKPINLQISERAIIFHYKDGSWLRSSLFAENWPPMEGMLNKYLECSRKLFPAKFWDALEQILPFLDNTEYVYFLGDKISTSPDGLSGATVACPNVGDGIFNGRHLLNLKGIAESVDFAKYPQPVPFFGQRSRGIIAPVVI